MFKVDSAKQLINLDDHDHTGSCPSIREIHEEYFQGIEEHLCKLLQALDQTSDSNCINAISSLGEWLWKFWHHRILCLQDKPNMQDSLRVAFAIDSANHGSPNSIISNVGLYADTVVITDPVLVFLRIAGGFNLGDSSQIRVATSIVV